MKQIHLCVELCVPIKEHIYSSFSVKIKPPKLSMIKNGGIFKE